VLLPVLDNTSRIGGDSDPSLTLAAQKDVAAATALLGPTTAQELESVLRRVPAVADLSRVRRDAMRAWLLRLYPARSPTPSPGWHQTGSRNA
jgi:hypothetical protein